MICTLFFVLLASSSLAAAGSACSISFFVDNPAMVFTEKPDTPIPLAQDGRTYMDAAGWTWYGDGFDDGVMRILLPFGFLNTIPSAVVINSATLYLYGAPPVDPAAPPNNLIGHSTLSGSNAWSLKRIAAAWSPGTVTWNNQPSLTTDGPDFPQTTSIYQDFAIDLTQMVAYFLANPLQNFGVMIKLQDEHYYRRVQFATCNYTDPARHPTFLVNYNATGYCDGTSCIGGFRVVTNGVPTCVNCFPGTYSDGVKCISCPAGTYSNVRGASACLPCGAGNFSKGGATKCAPCPVGYVSNQPFAPYGPTVCAPCSAGFYPTGNICKACLPGTYSQAGVGQCTPCPIGTYSNTSGSSECTPCPAGTSTQGASGARTCSPCPLGTFSKCGSASCTKCPSGSIAPVTGSDSCTICTLGLYTNNTLGSWTCTSCPTGTYSKGGALCTACPSGTYAHLTAMRTCLPCPSNTYSANLGANKCDACPSGTYSLGSSSTCITCPTTITATLAASLCATY